MLKFYPTLLQHCPRWVCVNSRSPFTIVAPALLSFCHFFEWGQHSLGCFWPFSQVENGRPLAACAQRHIQSNRQIHTQNPPTFSPLRFISKGLVNRMPVQGRSLVGLVLISPLCKLHCPLFFPCSWISFPQFKSCFWSLFPCPWISSPQFKSFFWSLFPCPLFFHKLIIIVASRKV
jgi:hypothetical protein